MISMRIVTLNLLLFSESYSIDPQAPSHTPTHVTRGTIGKANNIITIARASDPIRGMRWPTRLEQVSIWSLLCTRLELKWRYSTNTSANTNTPLLWSTCHTHHRHAPVRLVGLERPRETTSDDRNSILICSKFARTDRIDCHPPSQLQHPPLGTLPTNAEDLSPTQQEGGNKEGRKEGCVSIRVLSAVLM
jgi:hypothetical protein